MIDTKILLMSKTAQKDIRPQTQFIIKLLWRILMLQIATFYKKLQHDNLIAGGLGQGGGGYWEQDVGVRLQIYLAEALGGNLKMQSRPHGRDSFDRTDYDVKGGPFDIAYCQLFESPTSHPAEWVYSIISDYISMEGVLEEFLDKTRPNLLISFQYPLVPPKDRPDLVLQCSRYDCKVLFMPWFNANNKVESALDRDVVAMCTGKMGGTYPFRDAVYNYLKTLNRDDIVLSGNPNGSVFPLNNDDYQNRLFRCRYYITGGIYDIQIPPKYYEICNYGATLVSHELPMMKEAGFVDGETYIKIDKVEDIDEVIKSDAYKTVGPAGRDMVQQYHSIRGRAHEIQNAYIEDIESMC
jgi:hypothetical protein